MGWFSGTQSIYWGNWDGRWILTWLKGGYKRIPIPPIKTINMSLEFILAICWLALTFIILEVDIRLFVKNVTFPIPDGDHFEFFNVSLSHILFNKLHIIFANRVRYRYNARWGIVRSRRPHKQQIRMYVVAMEIGSGYKFFLALSFS